MELTFKIPDMPFELFRSWQSLAKGRLTTDKGEISPNGTAWHLQNKTPKFTFYPHDGDGAPKALQFKFIEELKIDDVPFEFKDVEIKVAK